MVRLSLSRGVTVGRTAPRAALGHMGPRRRGGVRPAPHSDLVLLGTCSQPLMSLPTTLIPAHRAGCYSGQASSAVPCHEHANCTAIEAGFRSESAAEGGAADSELRSLRLGIDLRKPWGEEARRRPFAGGGWPRSRRRYACVGVTVASQE